MAFNKSITRSSFDEKLEYCRGALQRLQRSFDLNVDTPRYQMQMISAATSLLSLAK